MKKYFMALIFAAALGACKIEETEYDPVVNYSSLQMQPAADTVFLSANGESRSFTLLGSVVNVSEKTISNTGVMTDARYTVRQVDTSFLPVDAAKATWLSSNSFVASVSNGIVVGRNAGYTLISAGIGNTWSASIVVNVRAVESAPGLMLDPPSLQVIFEHNVTVSGIVQQGARLSIFETNSGFNASNVPYSSNGSFSLLVTGLNPGLRTITARGMHATNNALFTDRSKTVLYLAPGTPEANAIVGNWLGTTLGENFRFAISNSVIPTRYDINGTIDIKFEGLGWVRDINLIGLINSNGTISVSLNKSYQGFTISGSLGGYFKNTGYGEGEYSAKAEKSGWPKISFNEKWTAVKE